MSRFIILTITIFLLLIPVAALSQIAGAASPPTPPSPKPPFTISTQTTALIQPLKPDGTVDYIAALNQQLSAGVTPENNGFVLWVRVMGPENFPQSIRTRMLSLCGASPSSDPTESWPQADDPDVDVAGEHPWIPNDHPKLAEFLKSHEKSLSLVVEAANRPRWWAPAVSIDGTMVGVLLPQLNPLRRIADSLRARAMLRAGSGDFDGFLSDSIALRKLALHNCDWTIISSLVAAGLDSLTDQSIGAAAGSGKFSASQCDQLAKALDALPPFPGIDRPMDIGERLMQLDFVASVAVSGDPSHPAHSTMDPSLRQFSAIDRSAVDWDQVLRQLNQSVDRTVATLKNPNHDSVAQVRRSLEEQNQDINAHHPTPAELANIPPLSRSNYSKKVADLFLTVLTPALAKAHENCQKALLRDQLTRTLIAAAQYHAQTGHWPQTLENLTPQYLPTPFKDPYSRNAAQPFQFLTGEKAILVYSVGPNATDDGGDQTPTAAHDDIPIGQNPTPEGEGL